MCRRHEPENLPNGGLHGARVMAALAEDPHSRSRPFAPSLIRNLSHWLCRVPSALPPPPLVSSSTPSLGHSVLSHASRTLSSHSSPLAQARYISRSPFAHFHRNYERFSPRLWSWRPRKDHYSREPQSLLTIVRRREHTHHGLLKERGSSLLLSLSQLLSKCAAYRAALLNMAKATAGFADAMEACSGYVALPPPLRTLTPLVDLRARRTSLGRGYKPGQACTT